MKSTGPRVRPTTAPWPVLDVQALLGHVRVLSQQFPHRHAGEEDELHAAEYIAARLREVGLTVDVLETPVMGWELTSTPRLELLTPDQQELECAPFIFSGSTPAHGLEGELRYIGRSFMAGGFEWEKYAIVDAAGQWKAFVAGRTDGPAIAQCGPPAGLAGGADTPLYLAGVRHR